MWGGCAGRCRGGWGAAHRTGRQRPRFLAGVVDTPLSRAVEPAPGLRRVPGRNTQLPRVAPLAQEAQIRSWRTDPSSPRLAGSPRPPSGVSTPFISSAGELRDGLEASGVSRTKQGSRCPVCMVKRGQRRRSTPGWTPGGATAREGARAPLGQRQARRRMPARKAGHPGPVERPCMRAWTPGVGAQGGGGSRVGFEPSEALGAPSPGLVLRSVGLWTQPGRPSWTLKAQCWGESGV